MMAESLEKQLALAPVSRRVTIAGRVTDDRTNAPLAGAHVTIDVIEGPAELRERIRASGGRPLRTAADGGFHYDDLPAGRYELTVRLTEAGTRYGGAKAEVEVKTEGGAGARKPAYADVGLPPTCVEGWVQIRVKPMLGAPQLKPVPMAEAWIPRSTDRTRADDQGHFVLIALEASAEPRTVAIFARGHVGATAIVGLPLAHAEALDSTRVSSELRDEFNRVARPLSPEAQIRVAKRGNRWTIVEQTERDFYLVRREGDELKVYPSIVLNADVKVETGKTITWPDQNSALLQPAET